MATIGELAVNVVANTQPLAQGLRDARRRVRSFGQSSGGMFDRLSAASFKFNQITEATGKVIRAAAKAVKVLVGEIDRLNDEIDVAKKLGTTQAEMAAMGLAAQRAGVSVNTFNMALQRSTRRISEAAQGTGEAKDAIAELGLEASQLNTMTATDRMGALLDALKGVSNESDRLRLAFKLFDSEGAALVNMADGGSRALREAAEAAEAFGTALTKPEEQTIQEAAEAFTDLREAAKGTWNQISLLLAPALKEFAIILTDILKWVNALIKGFRRLLQPWKDINKQARELAAQRSKARAAAEQKRLAQEAVRLREVADQQQRLIEQGKRLTESVRTPIERFKAELADVNMLARQGVITFQTQTRAVNKLGQALFRQLQAQKRVNAEQDRSTRQIAAVAFRTMEGFSAGLGNRNRAEKEREARDRKAMLLEQQETNRILQRIEDETGQRINVVDMS